MDGGGTVNHPRRKEDGEDKLAYRGEDLEKSAAKPEKVREAREMKMIE